MSSKIVKSGYLIFNSTSNRKQMNEIVTDACLGIEEENNNRKRRIIEYSLFCANGRAYLRSGFSYYTANWVEVRISTIEDLVHRNNNRKNVGKFAIPFSPNMDNRKTMRVDFIIDDEDKDLKDTNLHIDALWDLKELFPDAIWKDMYLKYWIE